MKIVLSIFLLSVVACQSIEKPVKPMVFASAAMKAADKARAERLAPDLYRKAEVKYWSAKTHYLQKDFTEAEKDAAEAKRLFEKAEISASLKALEDKDDE